MGLYVVQLSKLRFYQKLSLVSWTAVLSQNRMVGDAWVFSAKKGGGAFGGCDACFLEADGDDGWMLKGWDAGGLAFF